VSHNMFHTFISNSSVATPHLSCKQKPVLNHAQKRACNTATCVTHRLADFLSRSGGVGKNNFVPTNVGSKAFVCLKKTKSRKQPLNYCIICEFTQN
uniref:Calcitonin peptide-like domain-containing protein n=1 Tax=Pavo cristatus TaxID=9049 RepID=A0A8C9FSL4_PAVCR